MDDYHFPDSRGRKRDICIAIVQKIKESKGRFLKRDENDDIWMEVADAVAVAKVSHSFRTKKKVLMTSEAAGLQLFKFQDLPVNCRTESGWWSVLGEG